MAADAPEPLDAELKRFAQVFAAVESNAADRVNLDAAFYGGALPSMLRLLDPHSVFLDPGQYDQLKQMERSEQKGFGSVVSVLPGRVIVLQTLPGTPSNRAGLTAGDEILAINRIAIGALEPEQIVGLMTEARQRQALVHVRKPGNIRILEFTLTPELMDAKSVDRAFPLGDGLAYVRVASFDDKTGAQIREAIEQLGGANLKGLVLDLRTNPGGVVTAALETAALFLNPDQVILSVRNRKIAKEEARVPKEAQPYRFPVAVLIGAKTASAAEIVASALQDHRRARVFGESSFGKGLVQSVFPLSQNTAMLLTTAYYYTPSGRSLQRPLQDSQIASAIEAQPHDSPRGGVQPDDVVLPDAPTRLQAVLETSGYITAFATEFVSKRKIDESFPVAGEILDEFQVFLSARNIRPGLGEWLRDKEWMRLRLKQELWTIGLGVAKGDEIEVARDPVVRRAVRALIP
jgi:carboxyl-terminal processing protease